MWRVLRQNFHLFVFAEENNIFDACGFVPVDLAPVTLPLHDLEVDEVDVDGMGAVTARVLHPPALGGAEGWTRENARGRLGEADVVDAPFTICFLEKKGAVDGGFVFRELWGCEGWRGGVVAEEGSNGGPDDKAHHLVGGVEVIIRHHIPFVFNGDVSGSVWSEVDDELVAFRHGDVEVGCLLRG